MNAFTLCLGAVAPLFLMIAVGYGAKRVRLIREESVPEMNAVAFRIFMPLLCFYNVYSAGLAEAIRPRLTVFAVAAVLVIFVLSWLFAAWTVPRRDRRGVVVQGLYRSNYLIIGLPFASGLLGGEEMAVVSVLGAIIIPLYNLLAVIVLQAHGGKRGSFGRLLLGILTNPLILGSLAGIVFLLLKLRLPAPVESAVRDLSRVASPLLLVLLGAFFRFDSFRAHWRELLVTCVGRLVVIPGLALAVSALLGFRGVEFVALLAMFGASTAANSFTMAQQMGGDAALAGNIVVWTGALCTFTLFGWSLLFKTLGMF